MATTIALTTADNTLTVKMSDGTVIKQIWLSKTDGSKVQVYQKWKAGYASSNTQDVRIRCWSYNRKTWFAGKDKRSYCTYGIALQMDRAWVGGTLGDNHQHAFLSAWGDLDGQMRVGGTVARSSSSDGVASNVVNFSKDIYTIRVSSDDDYETKSYSTKLYCSYSSGANSLTGGLVGTSKDLATGTTPSNENTDSSTTTSYLRSDSSGTIYTYNSYSTRLRDL